MDRQKLIVVSVDALSAEDVLYLQNQSFFGAFMKEAARVGQVKSVYPTLTYPCHATMATGRWPKDHGIVNNYRVMPGIKKPDWNWFHDVYKVPDIIDRAKEAGLTTAVVGWPTMGQHRHADWIVAEIAGTSATTKEEFYNDYRRTGTTAKLWNEACEAHIYYRTKYKCVQYFNASAAIEIIKKHQPDLLLLHLGEPDHSKHLYGVGSKEVERTLDETDGILRAIKEAIDETDEAARTNLIVTSDHGQMNVTRKVSVNVLLAENGWIDVSPDGELNSWRAWSQSNGMSTSVYVKDPADEPAVKALLLTQLNAGYSAVYTREEAAAFGYAGGFSFVLETDDKTEFINDWTGPYCTVLTRPRGCHGFHPDKGERPVFFGVGPAFQTGAFLPEAELVDLAPTCAKVLGIGLPDSSGRALDELLI